MSGSLKKYVEQFEYIVTLNYFEDLDDFYKEMEGSGRTFTSSAVPEREIPTVNLKPTSLNTHFMMTEWEAMELKADPRVYIVEIHPRYLGITSGTCATTKQTSSGWDKSTSVSQTMLNWALLRCSEGVQRSGWGVGGTVSQTATVELSATGKNVDCVIVDGGNPNGNHPEYAVNANGTGGSRMISYNWFQHNPEVIGGAAGTYSGPASSHATHVSGTVAGNTQGWARDANIYNIYYDIGITYPEFSLVFDYVRAFHRNKAVNPAIGRKNPTITNNSWGMSIFPGEWSFSDITAVTYRGTRYTPPGEVIYLGYSGVCDANTQLATLLGFENFGNRITTVGAYIPPTGYILTKPNSWTQNGQEVYLSTVTLPDDIYTVTVQGPVDLNILHNLAINALSGSMTISGSITILQGATVINTYSDGPYTVTQGGSLEIFMEPLGINLPNNAVYTIRFDTTLDTANASNITYATEMRVTATTSAGNVGTASVTTITNTLLGAASLTSSTTPTVGNNDDGYWTLTLPFDVTYLGTNYNTIYIGANHYLTFTAGATNYSGLGPSTPNLPKIMWCSDDNSIQRIYYGVEGTAPNRTYRVRTEGSPSVTGTLGSPTMVNEWVFYEATPAQIDLQCGINAKKSTGAFTTPQLNAWGFIAGQRIPARVASCDADIRTAMSEGIIFVGAAGNGLWKHDLPGGLDWDNTFEMATRYPGSVAQPYYYMRGTSPTANDTNMPNICVGAVDANSIDQKSYYSDCGPGVDIWAPGTNIISSYNSGAADPRNASYLFGKINGTSMASPQVCGVLACALEVYPNMTPTEAKAYILGIAKSNQLTVTSGGPADIRDTQGTANLFLYYRKERETSGNVFPKINYKLRPAAGVAYPRPRIRRTL